MATIQRKKRRGAAAIEFGFWLLPLAILVSGIVDLGWYMSRYHMVQRAAMDGVRFGVRFGHDEDLTMMAQGSKQAAAANKRAQQLLDDYGLAGSPAASFQIDSPYDMLSMRVQVPFVPLVGIVPMPGQITADFEMMSERQVCVDGDPCP